MGRDKMTHKPWTLIHHEDQDVIELVLDGDEGTESIWVTYEEITALKELLGVLKTNPRVLV